MGLVDIEYVQVGKRVDIDKVPAACVQVLCLVKNVDIGESIDVNKVAVWRALVVLNRTATSAVARWKKREECAHDERFGQEYRCRPMHQRQ